MLRGTQHSSLRNFNGILNQLFGVSHERNANKICVQSNATQFTVSADLHEVDEASLDLWIKDRQLTLMADPRTEGSSKRKKPCPAPSAFFSCIDLPSDVDEDSIQAELKNGLLHISFKKERVSVSAEF